MNSFCVMLAAATSVVSDSQPSVLVTIFSEIRRVYHHVISIAGCCQSGGVLSLEYHAE
jgi:hypothetical protein